MKKELEGTVVIDDGLKFSLAMTQAEVERTQLNAIQQAVDTIRNRLNEFGLAEPTVAKQGEDKILVEVPGIKTQEDEQRIRELIARAAHLQLMAVDEDRNIRSRKDELLSIHLDNWGSSINNTVTQTALGLTPTQIRNSNTSTDGFINNSY